MIVVNSLHRRGRVWDVLMVMLSVLACGFYVAATYNSSYEAVQIYEWAETFYTQLFALDFIFNFLCAGNIFQYMIKVSTIIDLLTIVPAYVSYLEINRTSSSNLAVFRFVRILRLIRILRTFKLLGGLSGVRKQIITLSLTLTSMVFMAAGVIQLMENDVAQQMENFNCRYLNEATQWKPSCSADAPMNALADCDCTTFHCSAYYQQNDPKGRPSGLKCIQLTFLDAFYFMVVTGE